MRKRSAQLPIQSSIADIEMNLGIASPIEPIRIFKFRRLCGVFALIALFAAPQSALAGCPDEERDKIKKKFEGCMNAVIKAGGPRASAFNYPQIRSL